MALISPKCFDCVVAIGVDNPKDPTKKFWIGTGFLFGYRDDSYPENQYKVFIVSNKHVFNGNKLVYLRFNPQGGQPAKDYKLDLIDANGTLLYKQHNDADKDVAVAPINVPVLEKDGINVHFFTCDTQVYTISDLQSKGTTEGDGVFVLGYPMGNVGSMRQYVILRDGVVARIKEMLEGYSSDYIIDAFVFPGNSGGPVIIKPQLMAMQGTQPILESRLIGIVKSYIPYKDIAISPQTGRTRVVFEENTGLTNVEPVDYIIQTILQP